MKINNFLSVLLLFVFVYACGQRQTYDLQIIRRIDNSTTYHISGDSSVTINLAMNNYGGLVPYDGFQEVVCLFDSLNGSGTFSTSSSIDILGKPRYYLRYNLNSENETTTWYTSSNDSTSIKTNLTPVVGVMNFTYNIAHCDGNALTFDFDAGDTLDFRVLSFYSGVK